MRKARLVFKLERLDSGSGRLCSLYIDATRKPITNSSIAPKLSSVERLINVSSVPLFNVDGAQATYVYARLPDR